MILFIKFFCTGLKKKGVRTEGEHRKASCPSDRHLVGFVLRMR